MTQQQAGQPRLTPEDQETAVLLSLAYLGQLTLPQLARLLRTSARTIQRRLTQDDDSLVKRGLVARVDRADKSDERGMPTRGVAWWRLTEDGHRSIRAHDQYPNNALGHDEQYPARPATVRKRRLEHDSMVAETVICLAEAARRQGAGLSGLFARLECKLSPYHAAPWADALVVCHIVPDEPCSHPIPWTRDLPTAGELDWAFFVELDRGTEPLATIGGKAKEYSTMLADPRWQQHWAQRFGTRRPSILWVVPDAQRSAQVQRTWQEVWPQGQWYITTFDELRLNYWQKSFAGKREPVQFFGQAKKAAPPAAPAAPATAAGQTNPAPQQAPAATGAIASAQPSAVAPSTAPQKLSVGLWLMKSSILAAPDGKRVQLLDEAGRVVDEALLRAGNALLTPPVPEGALRLRVPELRVEVKLGPQRDRIELQLPEPPPPPPPPPDPLFERQPGDGPREWGDAAFEQAIDEFYYGCGDLSERINAQGDQLMQRAVGEGGLGRMLAAFLLAYISILPIGLCFSGQLLCVVLRSLARLGRALVWMLSTVWSCAWSKPEQRALTVLARLLLTLVFVVWLPLASWSFYDGELRSWPCRSYWSLGELYAFPTPGTQQTPRILRPGSELRCFTRTVRDERTTWRRVHVDGHNLWVEDRLLEPSQS